MVIEDKIKELELGEIEVIGRLVNASNASLYCRVGSVTAIYKPIAGERPLWDFPDGNLAQREVASYALSTAGAFNCVPTTVLRDGPFGLGAVQQWVDVNESIDIIKLGQSNLPSIRNIALLDVIVNNTDRKFGHLLPVSESEVYGCDHGVTFHEEFKLRTVIWQFAGQALSASERNQIELVQNFVERDQSFHSLLTAEEITATLERIEKLKNEGFPVPTEEWPAIPWPPV